MRPLRHPKLLAALAVVLFLIASTRAARANIGAPWSGGELAGEPAGLAGAAITHEDLVIDMRALAEAGGLVHVRATYEVENRAGDKHLGLLFASGAADPKNVTITLDDRPLATRFDKEVAIPPSWKAPDTTPDLGDSQGLSYGRELGETAPVAFQLDLPPGHHRLAVTYSADAMLQHVNQPTVVRQFAYVLAPARTWDAFGALDVTVQVPSGWAVATAPALARSGDTLHAVFPSLPADAVGITLQAPSRLFLPARILTLLAFAFVTLAGPRFLARRARQKAKEGKHHDWVAALALGLAWALAFCTAGYLALAGPSLTLGEGTADHYGYGEALALVALIFASLIVLVVGTVVVLRNRKAT